MVSGSLVIYKNKIEQYGQAIRSFLNCANSSTLAIVDNAGESGALADIQAMFGEYLENGRIAYLPLPANPGYGAGHNHGFKAINKGQEFHLVFNPDVVFAAGVLPEMERYLNDSPDVGLAVPKVKYADGRLQYLCKLLPTPMDLLFRRFIPGRRLKDLVNSRYELHEFSYERELNVPYLSGCFMFLRSSAFVEIGGFDERFFMYPEDIDLTRRIHGRYRTMYYPRVSIIHDHEKASYKSRKMMLIHVENMCRYFNKWGWFFDRERKEYNDRLLSELRQGE